MRITEEQMAELEKKRMKFYENFNHDEDAV
jgi:hypothetical protein